MTERVKVKASGKLEIWLKNVPDSLARSVLVKAGFDLATYAKRKMEQDGKVASGSIVKTIAPSVAMHKTDQGKSYWQVLVGPSHPAARFVFAGRKKGARQPPPKPLEEWMQIRGIEPEIKKKRMKGGRTRSETAEEARRRVAWAISRSIAKEGIPAYPLMRTAAHDMRERLKDQIREDIKRGMRTKR